MSGRVDESYYSKVKERNISPQSSVTDFSDEQETLVAVVSEPRGGIEDHVDEVWHELGMPKNSLRKFLEKRTGFRTNSAVDNPHERAYDECELDKIYRRYIDSDEDAQRKLTEAVNRLSSGENITLVCYEKPGESCHRHILVERLRDRLERRESSKFELSA